MLSKQKNDRSRAVYVKVRFRVGRTCVSSSDKVFDEFQVRVVDYDQYSVEVAAGSYNAFIIGSL